MTLGNHEYDWGEEYIEANRDAAEFPFLAINIYDKDTNRRVDYCDASVTVECGDITVGIIGAMGDCYSSISAEQSAGIYFKTGSELTALVKAESTRLREEGADIIIYSIHDGHGRSSSTVGDISSSELRSYYDVSLSNGYVDAVFEGHTHQNYIYRDDWGVYHLQGGGDNKGLTHLELAVNSVTGTVITTDTDFIRSTALGSLDGDPLIGDLAEKYKDDISKADDILGTNASYRSSDYIADLVALLYYEKGVEVWGADYDIVLGGGHLKLRSPYSLSNGKISYGDVYSILPFDNQIVLCSIKGKYLKSRFLNTNNGDYHIYKSPSLAKIDDNKTYYIITDTWTSTYKYNNLTEIARLDASTYARDLLADYIKDGGLE
jgi:2',3'-cyclic-nucleotide 2'-phosphodiesterase (5'-nucleotidase family)